MIFNIAQPIDKLANKKLFIESLSKGVDLQYMWFDKLTTNGLME
ncbi:MAG: hypothetical protein WAT12_10575 [Candidatus Nitrotoga sp.]